MIANLILAAAMAYAPAASAEEVPAPYCHPGPPIVYFDRGEARLSEVAAAILDHIAAPFINDGRVTRIVVAGYSDTVGSAATNMKLSRRRAFVVRNYLIRRGVAARRIEVQAMGETDPEAPPSEDPDEKFSRRVSVLEMVSPEEADRRLAAWPKGIAC